MKSNISVLILTIIAFAMTTGCKKQTTDSANPFLRSYNTPFGEPPFDKISEQYYKPAFFKGIASQNTEIEAIINNSADADFENTIVALDESGKILKRVAAVFYAIKETDSDTLLQGIASELSPILSEHEDNIYMNPALFARVKAVYDSRFDANLDTEQKMLVEKYYKSFVRKGILLDSEKQARLREINKELGLLTLAFGDNLLAETYEYQLVIDNKEDLSGLPADLIELAENQAIEVGLANKWLFNLSKPNWEPFLQYADNRALREKMYKAMYNRCNNGNEHDNKEIIRKIVNLRLEKANLLGFASHAAYALDNTMAKTPENAVKLLERIWKFAVPQADKEKREL